MPQERSGSHYQASLMRSEQRRERFQKRLHIAALRCVSQRRLPSPKVSSGGSSQATIRAAARSVAGNHTWWPGSNRLQNCIAAEAVLPWWTSGVIRKSWSSRPMRSNTASQGIGSCNRRRLVSTMDMKGAKCVVGNKSQAAQEPLASVKRSRVLREQLLDVKNDAEVLPEIPVLLLNSSPHSQ